MYLTCSRTVHLGHADHCQEDAPGVLEASPRCRRAASRLVQGSEASGLGHTPAAMKEMYGHASIVGDNRVIFNIKGNDYRLVVTINYRYHAVYIRFVGTHAEYDAVDVEEV
ncbi:MAG: type II toxin-antitoxin system HigB family toxin [Albidovulum sp.]|nr:type II toxin-antitoxin system HigB family toxin [Albidovulum sp.]